MPSLYPDHRTAVLALLRDRPGLTVLELADLIQGEARQADAEFAGVLSSLLTLRLKGRVRLEGERYYLSE